MKKLALSLFKSADEKLRSLGGKHNSKSSSSLSVASSCQLEETVTAPVRPPPPTVPPPPLPLINENPVNKHQEIPEDRPSEQEATPTETKPRLTKMAERRIQRQVRKEDGIPDGKPVSKRRSRSEGPHGRRRQRSSMHEGSRTSQQSKQISGGRYSMFAEPVSDDNDDDDGIGDNRRVYRGSDSDSLDSDDSGRKQWTKNPLLVRKTKRNNRPDNRKSLNASENGINDSRQSKRGQRISEPPPPPARQRELFIYQDKPGGKPGGGGGGGGGGSQKAKFQQLEERRKKRIDLAVTSDEECSPQSRISRLRQRAMLSTKLFSNTGSAEDINSVPLRQKGLNSNGVVSGIAPLDITPVSNVRKSMYDDADNRSSVGSHLSAQFYDNYTKQQGVPKTSAGHNGHQTRFTIQSGRALPIRKLEVDNRASNSVGNDLVPTVKSSQVSFPVMKQHGENPQKTRRSQGNEQSSVESHSQSKLQPNDSPQLRSFHEVKSSQAPQLKKAVERIKVNQGSPNSSSEDSLDELIESNIQYLESEIESGKLKRQSGNFSGYVPELNSMHRRNIPVSNVSAHDEIKFRLQGPSQMPVQRNVVSKTKEAPKTAQRATAVSTNIQPVLVQSVAPRVEQRQYPGTLSPYMSRRSAELADMEDLSKSDSQLSSPMIRHEPPPRKLSQDQSVAPYPVLHQQTGNIMYVQPNIQSSVAGMSLSLPSVDAGMFSDVEYNIEVSERIKKWEKKFNEDTEPKSGTLNTILETEAFSDSGLQDARTSRQIQSHPLREIKQGSSSSHALESPHAGVSKLSVTLAKSTSSISDSHQTRPQIQTYMEPKVISSETNLHRIFGVVQTPVPVPVHTVSSAPVTLMLSPTSASNETHHRRQRNILGDEVDPRDTRQAQSMMNVTLSESELSNMQQSWPPMAVDSDSGIRKSWRMSRFEEELSELKEIVSDNFRDLKKRFDSDLSENEVKRSTSPTSSIPHHVKQKWEMGLNVEVSTPKAVSPIPIRRQLSDTQPQSPVLSPAAAKQHTRSENKETKSTSNLSVESAADVWSPNMTSRKGLVSMERVKARTLQTIPFSEDPVWKEIEEMTSFERGELGQDDITKTVDFSDIEALLDLATSGTAAIKTQYGSNVPSERVTSPSSAEITSNNPMDFKIVKSAPVIPHRRARIMSDSSISGSGSKTFIAPSIQPLKLKVNQTGTSNSSANALDEVLEDIRNSLQRKPLSPKLLRNIDTSDSSANPSLQSPLTKLSKSFVFPKEDAPPAKSNTGQASVQNVYPVVPSTSSETTSQFTNAMQQISNTALNVPYIDPEFTQFPYIINGNYHLDPSLLSEKLKSTGLVIESSDERPANQRYHYQQWSELPANQTSRTVSQPPPPANQAITQKQEQYRKPSACVRELDKSVDELKELAKEVEYKLSQIKSKIVTADEDRLDTILLALRKFAPMTEQTYFDVRFTPIESGKVKKDRLEDALTELEKMYESLDLDDKALMDKAERREITSQSTDQSNYASSDRLPANTQSKIMSPSNGDVMKRSKVEKKDHVAEVERQTQNEFEDITKSFQVLLDEVTKQCRNVAQSASNYASSAAPTSVARAHGHVSSQPPSLEIHQEPPRSQLKVDKHSQRAMQDNYNSAIKGLENVALGSHVNKQSSSSSVYLNLNKENKTSQNLSQTKSSSEPKRITSPPNTPILRPRNLEIVLQSKAVGESVNKPVVTIATSPGSSGTTITPAVCTQPASSSVINKNKAPDPPPKRYISRKSDQDGKPTRTSGRFRKRNLEHRKSMPALTRSIETQTVETQTESQFSSEPSNTLKDDTPKSEVTQTVTQQRDLETQTGNDSSQTQDFSEDSTTDNRLAPVKRKLSRGIAKMVDLFSSSEDERGRERLSHSHSAPDLMALFDDKGQGQGQNGIAKHHKIDKPTSKPSKHKASTPRSIKHRHEAKFRFRSLHKDEFEPVKLEDQVTASSVTSEDSVASPHTNKPPVYPPKVQQKTESPLRLDKKQNFSFDKSLQDFTKNVSDTEKDKFVSTKLVTLTRDVDTDTEVVRRRTRSVGSDHEDDERPRSFHELVAAFENDPKRLAKLKQYGLRKCASADSMVTDLVLQKTYFFDSDVRRGHSSGDVNKTGSGLMLAMEVKVKTGNADPDS